MAVGLSSNISTKNAADTYATHLSNLGKGGVHSKDSIAAMNNISVGRRQRFMLCVVADTGAGIPGLFWLNTPTNPTTAQLADNQYWELVPFGSTVDGVLSLKGFQSADSLSILDGTGDTGDTFIVDSGGSVNNPNIFNGSSVTLVAGDYLVYESGVWNVIPTGASSVTWQTLTGKPNKFPPEAHGHTGEDITVENSSQQQVTLQSFISTLLTSNDIVTDLSSNPSAGKVVDAQTVFTLKEELNALANKLSSNDESYDTLQKVVDGLKSVITFNQNVSQDGELESTIDTLVGHSNWKVNYDNVIKQILIFEDATEEFSFTQAQSFRINSINSGAGVIPVVKLANGTTDYVIGDTVPAFTNIIFKTNIIGSYQIIGDIIAEGGQPNLPPNAPTEPVVSNITEPTALLSWTAATDN